MNNFLSLKLYKNNDLYLEKKSLNYAKTNNKYEFSLEDVLNTIIISEDAMVLTRDNKDSTLELTVNKNGNHKCRYLLKELDAYVDIVVDNILKGLDAQVNVLFINIVDFLSMLINHWYDFIR